MRFPRYIDQEVEVPGSGKVLVRRITGDSSPYRFPPPRVVPLTRSWPETPPFTARDFERVDESSDRHFYSQPRLVYHIDEPAVAALTQFYRQKIPPGSAVLDICSSWVSHYPREFPEAMSQICAIGISSEELKLNDQVTDGCFHAVDLNADDSPRLPYLDSTIDTVTCVVSIDYLIRPIQVLKEVNRVLKPGGQVLISQSDRCFPTKAIRLWLELNDTERLELIGGFLKYAGGYREPFEAWDITAAVASPTTAENGDSGRRRDSNDPMFVVRAVKKSKQ
jgi:SAM-dependent methyltransferase